jgi:XapX domain-containing protein
MKTALNSHLRKSLNTRMHELLAVVAGGVVGFLFATLRLPIPAPPTLAGVLGIVGITVGYYLAVKLFGQG